MAGFLGFFVFGALGWWLLSVCFFIFFIAATEKENGFWTFVCTLSFFAFVILLGKINIPGHIIDNPLKASLIVLGYLSTGFVWSFIKWWLFVLKIAEKRKALRVDYLEGKKETFKSAIPKHLRYIEIEPEPKVDSGWEYQISRNNLKKPLASENKGKISLWVVYWPTSVFWSLLDDLISKIVKQLILSFQKIYETITNSAFKNVA